MTTTKAEHAEMTEEIRRLLDRGNHPWMLLKRACDEGEQEIAQIVLGLADNMVRGTERLDMHYMYQRAFPEDEATGRQRREEERKASEAQTAGAIQERLERRRKARERIARRFKPVAGEHVPRDENKTYAEPNEGGFNTPIDAGAPEQRGFNRIRAMYNRPEGDDSA